MNKINLERLKEYQFVSDFINSKHSDKEFIENLKLFFKDSDFRELTGVNSLNQEDIDQLILLLKQDKRGITRRNFLTLLGGFFGTSVLPSKVLSRKKSNMTTAEFLYNEFSKIPQLQPAGQPIFSNNPIAPIVIIVQHIHGNLIKLEQLEILRKKFGFNFVGIEGWFGQEVDKKLVRELEDNMDSILIKKLINNKSYKVIGLENPEVHIEISEHILIGLYRFLVLYKNGIFYEMQKQSSLISKSLFDCVDKSKSNDYNIFKFEVKKCIYSLHFGHIGNQDIEVLNSNYFKLYGDGYIELRKRIQRFYGIKKFSDKLIWNKLEEIKRKYPLSFKNFPNENILQSERYIKLLMDSREIYAVSKMLKEIYKQKQRVGIIVFGKDHTVGLIKEFLNQTQNNINVIVIQ